MENDFFGVRFLYDTNFVNWLHIDKYMENDEEEYILYVNDDKNNIIKVIKINNNKWYNIDTNIFKYNLKLVRLNSGDIISQDKFDINNHKFNISLISSDKREIKIWKYYLWLVQIKYGYKFNIVENEIFDNQYYNYEDYICISRKSYDYYIEKIGKEVIDNISSLDIIRTLFNIVDDDSDIVNHTWITDNFFEL